MEGANTKNIVAPNGWTNVNIVERSVEPHVGYTGNDSTPGTSEFTVSSFVIQKTKKKQAIDVVVV